MKPIHGGGQPPIGGKDLTEYFHYLTEAGIPFSRLHDVGGPFGSNRYVDVPNIFRNFDADETDPASYDFTFTDHLLKALVEAGVEPYYRLGVTIENYAYIKNYRTDPPRTMKNGHASANISSVTTPKAGRMASASTSAIGRSGTSRKCPDR